MLNTRTSQYNKSDSADFKRREDERRKKELDENIRKEKGRKDDDARRDRNIIQSKLSVKKRNLFLKKQEIENLEREAGIIDRDIRNLKSDIESVKFGSENEHLQINMEKHKLAGLATKLNEKKKGDEKIGREISELEKDLNYIKEDIKKKERKESLKNSSANPKESDKNRREAEKNRIERKISGLKDEERRDEQEIAELERQFK